MVCCQLILNVSYEVSSDNYVARISLDFTKYHLHSLLKILQHNMKHGPLHKHFKTKQHDIIMELRKIV